MYSPSTNSHNGSPYVGMEKDLNEDAVWKKIQQNTFTRWTNERLKCVNLRVDNLEKDLSDGLLLIALVEVLSTKKIHRFNKKPTLRTHKLENVSLALKFLEDVEGVHLVNIDSTHIVDQHLKLILGLVWTLILKYSISIPMYVEGSDENKEAVPTEAPKKRLMTWIQAKVPEKTVANFTSDWKDGRALGALVDSCAPGLCPDWSEWQPKYALENTTEAMELADNWLGVPKLIEPQEFLNPNVDEMSMMTYLSQYPNAKIKQGAPVRPKTDFPNIRVYGSGIESKNLPIGHKTEFSVEIPEDSSTTIHHKGRLHVLIKHYSGIVEQAQVTFDEKISTYVVSYIPTTQGAYSINLSYNGRDLSSSPYKVQAEPVTIDFSSVKLSGPGIIRRGEVTVHNETYFEISCGEQKFKKCRVVILEPDGKESEAKVEILDKNRYRVVYTPLTTGLHSINVFLDGKPLPESPFGVDVKPKFDAKKVTAWGRGIQPKGVRVGDTVNFTVDTQKAGKERGKVEIRILNTASRQTLPVVSQREIDDRTVQYSYEPIEPGNHEVHVLYEDQPITRSPFEVYIGPKSESNVKAFGPGIETGVENQPCVFTVDRNGETGSIGFSIEGPSQTVIECNDKDGGSADVIYTPKAAGHYAVHVLCANEDIPNSPFVAEILPQNDALAPNLVKCHGPGIQTHVENKGRAEFTVDASQAGKGQMKVSVIGPDFKIVDSEVVDNGNGTFSCFYEPTKSGRHFVMVSYGGVSVPDSPFRINVQKVADSSKIRVFGPGLTDVKMNEPTYFTLNLEEAGEGDLRLEITDENGNEIPIELIREKDENNLQEQIVAKYTPQKAGVYEIRTFFAGKEIAQSPLKVMAKPVPIDTTKIQVDNLKDGVFVNASNDFRIDCRLLPEHGADHLTCVMREPSGKTKNLKIDDNSDGTYKVNYTPEEEGVHNFDIYYDNIPVSHTIFSTVAQVGSSSKGCYVSGPGLRHAFVNVPANFVVDAKDAGKGKLNITIEGPSNPNINCLDQKDGSYLVNYTPTEPGDYDISIQWDRKEIEGSPYHVHVEYPVDSSKVKAYGEGLEPEKIRPNVPLKFYVDASQSGGLAPLNVTIVPEKGTLDREHLPKITELSGNRYDVVYFVPNEGTSCSIHITYGDKEIPNSPYHLKILSSNEPDKVRLLAPGGGEQIIPLGEVPASVPVQFTVDTSKAGPAPLEVIVVGPDDQPYPVDVLDRENGLYDVSFVPDTTGPYSVRVNHGGHEIADSPFNFAASPTGDASKCLILDGINEAVLINEENRVIVNASQAGSGSVTCRIVPTPVGAPFRESPQRQLQQPAADVEISQDKADGTFCIKYRLRQPGQYKICIKFGGQPVPKGEWTFTALSSEDFDVRNLQYNSENSLRESLPVGVGGLTEQQQKREEQQQLLSRSLQITEERLREEELLSSSSTSSITSSSRKIVSTKVAISRERYLDDRSSGLTEETSSTTIYESPEQLVQGDSSTRLHRIIISDSPRDHEQQQEQHLAEQELSEQPDSPNYPVEYWNISLPSELENISNLESKVVMPSGKTDLPIIKDNHDGTVTVKYQPMASGLHEMHILYDEAHVQGSPFQFHVEDVKDGHVTVYGPGLTYGTVGNPCTFTICVKEAGAGGLSIVVDGPAKSELQCHDNHDGTCSVVWVPPAPGEYKVSIKYSDKEIKGSPFAVKVAGEGRKRAHISVGSTSEVSLKISEPDLKGMSASIKSPSGIEEPCFIRRLDDGHLGISFTPRETGEHLVSVKKKNVLLPGAPFKINVGESEVGNANKVKLTGPGLEHAQTQEFNEFLVNTKNAGFGGLSVSIEGPSKCEIVCKENKDGICKIHYKPSEPGIYVLSVKFADHNVPGSPYTVKCQGIGAGTVSEQIDHERKSANVVFADQECQLCIKIPGTNAMDLSAKLTSPSHRVEDVELFDSSDSSYVIKFTPKETGLHTISVLHQGSHISGSPFQFTVGPFLEGGAHKVRAGGTGLSRGEVAAVQAFNIYTREAGAGNLSIGIDGPSKAKIDFKEHKDGNCYVTYVVTKPGDYAVSVKFDGHHVPDSPFPVYISPSIGESRKLGVVSMQTTGLAIDKPVTFTILTHGAKGHLDAKVLAPSGAEDDCYITPIDEESYAVRFIPREPGSHYAHIRLDGVHMTDSPFRLRVGGKEEADPTAVSAAGDGLKGGETGQKLEYIINTCNAGAGILNVSIDGPSKVTLDMYEVDVGYKVRYTAMAPGDYFMTIKYNNIHVPGSPFKVQISGKTLGGSGYNESSALQMHTVAKSGKGVSQSDAPKFSGDASKVESKGMGLKKANLGRHSTFTVDTSQAGQDLLFVAVLTPKGPSEEIQIKYSGRGQYQVNYLVREKGVCYVYVKYGHKDVPGSPFPVEA